MAHALSEDSVPAEVPPVAKGKWSDFAVRAASALVLAPVAIFCAWSGGWAWAFFIGLAMAGLGWEWGRLARLAWPQILTLCLLAVWFCAVAAGPLGTMAAFTVTVLVVWAALGRFAAIGIPYAGLGGIALLWLRLVPGAGLTDTIFLILVVWGTDCGAYAVGRLIGGRKLAPKISPGKTWSGSVGGLLIGAACGAGLAALLHGNALLAFALGLLLSLCAQGGDLLESAIKRRLGVKDSGRTIPGHGGLFDRLDGFLAAAPVAAILSLCVHGGVPLWG